ncbi:site-specific integrase [Rubrobacter indicoceani]|uniref:site-specific integrase n=1 Tax=Rubrobacter indicoceani TaxID=2051957 RepID=UPI001F093023|nr:site-specific integrase [Rubrobacter indicoceani]
MIYGKRYKDVEKKLVEARGDAARGIVYNDENLTVGAYLDRWLSGAVRGSVRESTYFRDECLVRTHVKPALSRVKLSNLNAMHIQGLYADLLRLKPDGAGLSGSTVQKIHHVLHKALSQAVRWDLIPRNPADGVKAPTPSTKEMRPLSGEEARRLLETAAGDRLEALYVLAVHTGMRRGELLGLKWEDVDLDSPTIRIRRTMTRTDNGKTLALGEPKTKQSRRTVRLTPRAVEALRRHRVRQAEEKLAAGGVYEDHGFVFAGEIGNLINPSNLRQRSFIPLLERAGLPQITFHDLRHTCASLLFSKNVHPKLVQELLGHARVAITLDTYSHMLPGMGGEAADAITEALG